MNCKDCEWFKIAQEPIRYRKGIYFDRGLARCKKHGLVLDFFNYGKINRLKCVEEKYGEDTD